MEGFCDFEDWDTVLGICAGRITLKRGETKRVEILLPHDAFAFYDTVRHDFVVEPGDFLIQVGASSRDLRLKGTIRVD